MTGQQDPLEDAGLREDGIEIPASAADRDLVEPVAVGPGDPGLASPATEGAAGDAADGDASLLALVDRLVAMLDRSDLGELEVAAGQTTVILRTAAALERHVAVSAPVAGDPPPEAVAAAPAPADVAGRAAATAAPAAGKPSVKAPLTGIYYGAPSPGATPYIKVGDHVAVGQIIGLIEAMKLFNEIKSDLAGRVVRICAENGALVKAKSPLIEVEPA